MNLIMGHKALPSPRSVTSTVTRQLSLSGLQSPYSQNKVVGVHDIYDNCSYHIPTYTPCQTKDMSSQWGIQVMLEENFVPLKIALNH